MKHMLDADGCYMSTGRAVGKVHTHVEKTARKIEGRRVVDGNGYEVGNYPAGYAESKKNT